MKLFITLCAVLATATAVPNHFNNYLKNSKPIAGCETFCEKSIPEKNISLGNYVPESIISLTISQLCASLQSGQQNHKILPNFMRHEYLHSNSFQDMPSLPSGFVCAYIYASAFDETYKPEGNLQILLDKIQVLPLSVICELFPSTPSAPQKVQAQDESAQKPETSVWNNKCSKVCVPEDPEGARLSGVFLEELRVQSLRKACKEILLSGLVGISREANESVISSKFDSHFLTQSINFIESHIEGIKKEKKSVLDIKRNKQEALEQALKLLEGKITDEEVQDKLSFINAIEQDISRYNAALASMDGAVAKAIEDMRKTLQVLNEAFETEDKMKKIAELTNAYAQTATAVLHGLE